MDSDSNQSPAWMIGHILSRFITDLAAEMALLIIRRLSDTIPFTALMTLLIIGRAKVLCQNNRS